MSKSMLNAPHFQSPEAARVYLDINHYVQVTLRPETK